jgi:endonuclease/exonuclease/phosphatase family metal-dependent hydrolase
VDGKFDEWSSAATILEDGTDAPGSTIDLGSILGLDDAHWLYLSLDLGREVNVQSLPGTLKLLVDADAGGPQTGSALHGMDGVDLVVELSQTDVPLVAGRGSGFALRAISEAGTMGAAVRYALGVTAAPSWAASRFEFRMSRLGVPGLPTLEAAIRLKAVYVVEDQVEEETPVGSYTFRTAKDEPTPAPTGDGLNDRLAKSEGSVRVAQWNASSGSFTRNSEGFARVLAAIAPDVILLDELPGGITREALRNFFALESLGRLGTWQFVLGEAGGRQRTVVAALDREIRPAQSMRSIRYPDGALERLRGLNVAEFDPSSDMGTERALFDRLLDLEAERHLSATGAWVEVAGQEVLFVPLDLQSAGWTGSPRDQLRALQARTIHDHIVRENGPNGRPVVIGGDFNLVGAREPLLTLAQGLDVDGSELTPVDAPRLGERTYVTWRNAEGLFAPGRLDFLLVPDAAATVTNSFVFGTEDLDPATLQRLSLERELSASLSDHLVVTVDLAFR